ncbi:MAG: cytochrome P460 family protein [Geminicoccaceae bacterium]
MQQNQWRRFRAGLPNAALHVFVIAITGPVLWSSPIDAEDGLQTEEHFNVQAPALLSASEAEAIYEGIIDEMIGAYALSQDPSARAYRRWRRFNAAPYQSATHGSRYVNNYANPTARSYDRLDQIDHLPVGSVLAKDSFAVTEDGDVFLGPLFLMEKMEMGFDPAARDWRYSMIMPDGSFFGDTLGPDPDSVGFCITCHQAAGDERDHLFFVPEDARVED